MSSYQLEVIRNNMRILDDYCDLVDEKVLEQYRIQIKQLPFDEQKKEWYKYNLIDTLISQSLETVIMMNEYLSTMHTHKEFISQENYIQALRKYIKELGGNPSSINYYKLSDL